MAAPEGLDFELDLPVELAGGAYANVFSVWYSPDEFTIDFAARVRPTEAGESVPSLVVARVRVPVSLIFGLLRALNKRMTDFESDYGEIRRPGREGDASA